MTWGKFAEARQEGRPTAKSLVMCTYPTTITFLVNSQGQKRRGETPSLTMRGKREDKREASEVRFLQHKNDTIKTWYKPTKCSV